MKHLVATNVFRAMSYMVVMVCLGVYVGCDGAPGSGSCYPCTPGTQSCTADRKYIKTCEQSPGTQCYSITLRPCQGGLCDMSSGAPKCQAPCQDACQQGQFSCADKVLSACEKDVKTGCFAFTTIKVCGASETCDATTGICQGDCIVTNEKLGLRCDGDAVYWYDNCNNKRSLNKQCKADETCEKADCVKQTCEPKDPYHKKQCEGTSVYYYDDCGNKGEKQQDCPSHLKCINGECVDCKATNPQAEKKCDGNAVYWYDNCGTKGEKVEDCGANATCESGACKGQCQDACSSEGAKQCDQNNGVQTCTKGTDGCLAWGTATPCPSGQSCKLGVCNASTCPDECPTLNDTKCDGDKIRTCVEDTNLKCNRWSAAVACSNGQTCKDGKCGGAQCNNKCSPGQKQCGGTGVQECQADANGCYDWGTATPCPTGQTCNNGICAGSSSGSGPQPGETGASCTSGSQCSQAGGGCITNWPSGYCTKLCGGTKGGCPSDAVCGQLGSNPPLCLRKCSSTADCNTGYSCKSGACLP